MSSMITQHADAATLMSFAAGSLAEPLAAVVAAHAAMCRQCRDELADLDMLGAALLLRQTGAPGDSSAKLPDGLAKSGAREIAGRKVDPAERLPAPIALAYNLSFEIIPWKRLGPGVWHHRLPLSEGVTGDLRLLKIAAGRQMPDHGHGGAELTLVLDGAFSDATGEYKRGDL